MILLNKEQYHLANQCFESNYPNITFVKSVIEHKMPGNILIDSYENPRSAFVLTQGPYGFLSNNFDFGRVKNLRNILTYSTHNNPAFKLMVESSPSELIKNCDDLTIIDRLHFNFNQTNINIHDEPHLENLTMRQVDHAIFDRCNWKGLMLSLYGSIENYLKHGAGFCLLHNKRVVSEAHAIRSDNFSELGVFTDPMFRNRGLSTAVCRHLLSYCVNHHSQPKWTCDTMNKASYKLALKLGFDHSYNYQALALINRQKI
jgi:GNAT superfamily N-acetyltransferase